MRPTSCSGSLKVASACLRRARSILDAYDEAEGELLVLGAPGAGKSTLLLDLAQQLVSRAIADPTQPLPVILRLSSWALGRPALCRLDGGSTEPYLRCSASAQ